MLYKSWKELEDKTYIIGGFNQKSKPRDLLKELLKEGEEDFLKRTGTAESVYYFDASVTIHKGIKINEILLPSYIGKIKRIQINGLTVDRFNNGNIDLGNNLTVSDGSPSAWNMKGDRILTFDANLASSDYVAVFYESTAPSPSLLLKAHYWSGHADNASCKMYVEPHANLEFCKYWNGKSAIISYESSGTWGVVAKEMFYGLDTSDPTDDIIDVWYDRIYRVSEETGLTGAGPMTYSFSKAQDYAPGTQQSYLLSDQYQMLHTKIAGTGSGKLDSFMLPNYRELYGPTIKPDCQGVLPYYALGVLLHSESPESAEFYMQKFLNYTDEKTSDFLDNDLTFEIETKTRSNWRNL